MELDDGAGEILAAKKNAITAKMLTTIKRNNEAKGMVKEGSK